MCIAAGIGGAAIVGAYVSDRASKRAADAAESGANASSETQRYMYDTTRNDYAPYRTVGASALNQLASLYGLEQYSDPEKTFLYNGDQNLLSFNDRTPMANASLYANDPLYKKAYDEVLTELGRKPGESYSYKSDSGRIESMIRQKIEGSPEYRKRIEQPVSSTAAATGGIDLSSFYDSPDYQFAFDEGNRAVQSSLAARGLIDSGAAMKEITRYGQGMASQRLGDYTSRLAALAGIGQSSTGSVANAGMNAAQSIGQSQMAAGDARASSYTDRASNINNLINQGVGGYMMSQLAQPAAAPVSPYNTYSTGNGYAMLTGR